MKGGPPASPVGAEASLLALTYLLFVDLSTYTAFLFSSQVPSRGARKKIDSMADKVSAARGVFWSRGNSHICGGAT